MSQCLGGPKGTIFPYVFLVYESCFNFIHSMAMRWRLIGEEELMASTSYFVKGPRESQVVISPMRVSILRDVTYEIALWSSKWKILTRLYTLGRNVLNETRAIINMDE